MACPPSKCAACDKPCASRSAVGPNGEGAGDEDLAARLEAALGRARVAEEAYEKLKMEAQQNGSLLNGQRELKPLRSQAWFNNAHNPGRHTQIHNEIPADSSTCRNDRSLYAGHAGDFPARVD